MNYIGSKYKLLPFLRTTIENIVGNDLSEMTFCDLFAGTGIVGRDFKTSVHKVISNDIEYYSFVLNRNYIGNHTKLQDCDKFIEELNNIPLRDDGFVYNNYCVGGNGERQYFSDNNGRKIDSVRMQIEKWKENNIITEDMYFFLLCSLLESADKVANTASVYGAYLKNLKKSAQKALVLEPATFELNDNDHKVYQKNANDLIKEIAGDILYLDPPYNERQYGANYHILNTIAEYKPFVPKGKTGLRAYNRSKYCIVKSIRSEFEELIATAKFRYIFLSYNNEGLMNTDDIRRIMEKYGHYELAQTEYHRFKADKTENRNHKADSTTEYLHILLKNE